MDKKTKKANEVLMRRVNNKIKKDWNDGISKTDPRKKTEATTEKKLYDRGDSKLTEPQKDGKISLDNLIEDINRRAILKMGLKKKKDIEKPKSFVTKNINNITPRRNNEKPIEEAHYKLSDNKERKRIFDKYTIKLKDHNINPIIVNRVEAKKLNENLNFNCTNCSYRTADKYFSKNNRLYLEMTSKSIESKLLELTDKKDDSKNTSPIIKRDTDKIDIQRKPIIKTVSSKNDSKIYKAVTFGNKKKLTQLQINMPNDSHKRSAKSERTRESSAKAHDKESSNSKTKLNNSKTSIKEKPKRKKKEVVNLTPDYSKDELIPQTEVAMWAPASVNSHTKPYYEAWVDKTLAAISRLTIDDEKVKEKKSIAPFYRIYGRPSSPDLTYANFADERYTGRIKVTQR